MYGLFLLSIFVYGLLDLGLVHVREYRACESIRCQMLTTRSSISRDDEMIVNCNFAGCNAETPSIGASRGPRVEARVELESVVVEATKPPLLVPSVGSASCLRLLFAPVASPLFVDIVSCRG